MIKFENSRNAWEQDDFDLICKHEIESLDKNLLPLQQGLQQTSHVGSSDISVVILNSSDNKDSILVKTSIFYSGTIAGSCCADDPTPIEEMPEHCELLFEINKTTAETKISVLG